jgi:hypothetical protein
MLAVFRKYVTITLLLTASICLGQSRRGDVIANIPFPFVVDGHALSPGRYVVTPIGETNLRIYANKQSVIFQTHSVTGKAPEGIGKMVFHRYGDAYFLSEIWVAANSTGRQLSTLQAEKELVQKTNSEVVVLWLGRE